MRHISFTLFLGVMVLFAAKAVAFENEGQANYPTGSGSNTLKILSTADINVFEPLILAFQQKYPSIEILYTVASSTEVMRAVYDENRSFDLVISSAMDLQTKLANDGFALTYSSSETNALPGWAKWRNQIFAFSQEPAVLVLSEAAFRNVAIPSTREELINLLREKPEIFRKRIGTYDVRISGLGYLFATQDSRNTESFWRLTEVMGRLETQLYCCSGQMISDVSKGKLAFAYNVLGSYASSQLADKPGIRIVRLSDFISVMLRSVLIPKTVKNLDAAGLMIDFLTNLKNRPDLVSKTGLPSIDGSAKYNKNAVRPIRLGPGLLVFLDSMRRETFLRSWVSSIIQP